MISSWRRTRRWLSPYPPGRSQIASLSLRIHVKCRGLMPNAHLPRSFGGISRVPGFDVGDRDAMALRGPTLPRPRDRAIRRAHFGGRISEVPCHTAWRVGTVVRRSWFDGAEPLARPFDAPSTGEFTRDAGAPRDLEHALDRLSLIHISEPTRRTPTSY